MLGTVWGFKDYNPEIPHLATKPVGRYFLSWSLCLYIYLATHRCSMILLIINSFWSVGLSLVSYYGIREGLFTALSSKRDLYWIEPILTPEKMAMPAVIERWGDGKIHQPVEHPISNLAAVITFNPKSQKTVRFKERAAERRSWIGELGLYRRMI